jgi:preprotein translocase subunit SecE
MKGQEKNWISLIIGIIVVVIIMAFLFIFGIDLIIKAVKAIVGGE